MTIVGTMTNDFEIHGGIDYPSHQSLLFYNGKRFRYRDGVVIWYIEPTEQEQFALEQWLDLKGYPYKSQFTMTNINQVLYFHGK